MQRLLKLTLGALLLGACAPGLPPAPTVAPLSSGIPDSLVPVSEAEATTAALGDADPAVRRIAARTLGGIGPDAQSAVPALVAALADGDPAVRTRAAEAIGKIGSESKDVAAALARLLEETDESVLQAALASLGELGAAEDSVARESLPQVSRLLNHGEASVRSAAAQTSATSSRNSARSATSCSTATQTSVTSCRDAA